VGSSWENEGGAPDADIVNQEILMAVEQARIHTVPKPPAEAAP
jgi:hypothetical protein